jgi:hypothetical protein
VFTEILNHADQAVDRLVSQFATSYRLQNLVRGTVGTLQQLEYALSTLNMLRSLGVATGVTLDRIGEIVGVKRPSGALDDTYRLLIQAQIGVNISEGEPERIISTFKILKQAPLVIYYESYPGGVAVQGAVTFTDQDDINTIISSLERVALGGVQ